MVVYEDAVAQQRAMALWERVARLVGAEAFRADSWGIDELNDPSVAQAATAATIRADTIVVSIRAAAKLSAHLCRWIDAWLPQRQPFDGTLIAVVGVAGQPIATSDHAQEYLRDVARQARMDFLLQEYRTAPPIPEPQVASNIEH